ncbi:MAG: histidine--tRNA ligase [Anaerolineae bacterium]
MSAVIRLTGFQDVLPEDRIYWDFVMSKATDIAQRFGFLRLDPPLLESIDLFARGNGEASDFFVNKEMYAIEESDGSYIALRPEFTAGMVRAYVQNKMYSRPQPVKLFTFGPAFRRERAQAGRYRQHTQFDCEILGETDPAADLEVMMVAMSLYREMGYSKLAFQLNSTGCKECKPVYVEALKSYLAEHLDKLGPIDQERLRLNPLRILDSKEKGMNELLSNAPHIIDHLCEDCATHLADLRKMLEKLDADYEINFRLVRGIDYYTKTVFEVWDTRIGAQAALCGGGRYDGLAEAIGGPSTPGVGFGLGVERAVLGLKQEEIEPPALPEPTIFVAHFGGDTKIAAVNITYKLRAAGVGTRLAFARDKRSMKSQMREANKYPISHTIIVGEGELEAGTVTIRPMAKDGGEQFQHPIDDVVNYLASNS